MKKQNRRSLAPHAHPADALPGQRHALNQREPLQRRAVIPGREPLHDLRGGEARVEPQRAAALRHVDAGMDPLPIQNEMHALRAAQQHQRQQRRQHPGEQAQHHPQEALPQQRRHTRRPGGRGLGRQHGRQRHQPRRQRHAQHIVPGKPVRHGVSDDAEGQLLPGFGEPSPAVGAAFAQGRFRAAFAAIIDQRHGPRPFRFLGRMPSRPAGMLFHEVIAT